MPADAAKSKPKTSTAINIAALEAIILQMLHQRGPGKTICPSEVAKQAAGTKAEDAWRPLMKPVRIAAQNLADSGDILITQRGQPINLSTAKGPIRLRLYQQKT